MQRGGVYASCNVSQVASRAAIIGCHCIGKVAYRTLTADRVKDSSEQPGTFVFAAAGDVFRAVWRLFSMFIALILLFFSEVQSCAVEAALT